MTWFKSIFHSAYLLFLSLMIVLLGLNILSEGQDIYWFASMLVCCLGLLFFVIYAFGGWRHLPTVRLIMTACIGAGALIVFGNWYSDKEENTLPLIAACGALLGWLFWDLFYNRVPAIGRPESLPEAWVQKGSWNVLMVTPHGEDPSLGAMLRDLEQHPVGAPVTLLGPEMLPTAAGNTIESEKELQDLGRLNPSSRPVIAKLLGKNLKGGHPALLITNPNGELVYYAEMRDRRRMPSAAFIAKIVAALKQGSPVIGV